jgi:hypothetical protein
MTDIKVEKTNGASRTKPHSGMKHGGSYFVFFAMIGTSAVLMYLLMFLNIDRAEHVVLSEIRMYMTFIMAAVMTVVMLAFMLNMYKNKTANIAIFSGAIALFIVALWLVRSQETVQDESWMTSMIPHHSVAVMTSSRAEFSDYRVAELAAEIVEVQEYEIALMEWLLADIEANGEARTPQEADRRAAPESFPVVPSADDITDDIYVQPEN